MCLVSLSAPGTTAITWESYSLYQHETQKIIEDCIRNLTSRFYLNCPIILHHSPLGHQQDSQLFSFVFISFYICLFFAKVRWILRLTILYGFVWLSNLFYECNACVNKFNFFQCNFLEPTQWTYCAKKWKLLLWSGVEIVPTNAVFQTDCWVTLYKFSFSLLGDMLKKHRSYHRQST